MYRKKCKPLWKNVNQRGKESNRLNTSAYISDRDQIENLLHSYARGVDTGNLKSIAELFRDGSICGADGDTLAAGYDAVLEMYSSVVKIYQDCGTPKTQHLVSNLILDIDSDETASGTANYTVLQQMPDGKIECIIAGEYFSRFLKNDGQWQFHEHHMRNRITGDLSHHLLIEIDEITQGSNNGITG